MLIRVRAALTGNSPTTSHRGEPGFNHHTSIAKLLLDNSTQGMSDSAGHPPTQLPVKPG